jgi:hypothetical protein
MVGLSAPSAVNGFTKTRAERSDNNGRHRQPYLRLLPALSMFLRHLPVQPTLPPPPPGAKAVGAEKPAKPKADLSDLTIDPFSGNGSFV